MEAKYWAYIGEREGAKVVENDHGFATYKKVSQDTYYLMDIWVKPDYRKTNCGTKLMEQVILKAKEDGATRLMGSCCPSANGSTISLMAMLRRGFSLLNCEEDMIYLVKDI